MEIECFFHSNIYLVGIQRYLVSQMAKISSQLHQTVLASPLAFVGWWKTAQKTEHYLASQRAPKLLVFFCLRRMESTEEVQKEDRFGNEEGGKQVVLRERLLNQKSLTSMGLYSSLD